MGISFAESTMFVIDSFLVITYYSTSQKHYGYVKFRLDSLVGETTEICTGGVHAIGRDFTHAYTTYLRQYAFNKATSSIFLGMS